MRLSDAQRALFELRAAQAARHLYWLRQDGKSQGGVNFFESEIDLILLPPLWPVICRMRCTVRHCFHEVMLKVAGVGFPDVQGR